MMCPRCVGGHGSKSQLYKRPLLLGTLSQQTPQKTEKSHTFLGQHKGQNGFTSEASKFKPRNMHLKDSFDESLWCFTCFCWWGFGGKNVKMLQGLPRKEAGAHHKRMLCPLHLGHPQTANCQFRKLDIRQFLLCPQMGHVVFFAKISENAWRFLNFANNAIQDNPFQILQTPGGALMRGMPVRPVGEKKRPFRASPASLRLCLKPSAPRPQKVRFKFFNLCFLVSY